MIKDTIDQISRYAALIPNWEMISSQIDLERLRGLDENRYDLEDGESYFLIAHYQTRTYHDIQFESHRRFIDIQIILEGLELIYTAPLSRVIPDERGYDADKDIQFGETSVPDILMLKAGDFAIFFPEDAHNPNCMVGSHTSEVRKAVFKIPIP